MVDKIENEQLEDIVTEAEASNDVDAESADAVPAAGGTAKGKNRKADVNKSVDPAPKKIERVKTPEGPNNVGIKESLDGLFDGEDLSEDFKTKTTAIFEAAVHERVEGMRADLEEEAEVKLTETLEEATADIMSKVDGYLDYVVEQWMEANEVAVEASIKVEVAESLISSLQSVVVEHNLNITDEEVDAVAELEDRLAESDAKYNQAVDSLLEARELNEAMEREIAFSVISESLTDTQAEKLKDLSEGLSFNSVEEFEVKLIAVRDQYFTESVVAPEEQQVLEEEVESEEAKTAIDPVIGAYMADLDKLKRR